MPSVVAQRWELHLHARDLALDLAQDFGGDVQFIGRKEDALPWQDQIYATRLRDIRKHLRSGGFDLLHALVERFLKLAKASVYETLGVDRLLLERLTPLVKRFRRENRGLLLQLLLGVAEVRLALLYLALVGVPALINLFPDALRGCGLTQNYLKVNNPDHGRRQLLPGR